MSTIEVEAVQIGIPGRDGVGIASITEEVSEEDEGLNIIHILMTDGSYYDLTVQNGSGTEGPQGEAGVSVESAEIDEDGCLVITLTDGTVYTSGSLRGEDGAAGSAGNGIADITSNADFTLTLTMDDGTTYTTGSLRGAQGETGATGPQGETGATGAAGYTPVRGTDYWTAADQAAIVAAVVAAFTDGDTESYGGTA